MAGTKVDVVVTITARRVDATARAMMAAGVRLTADQIDEIGDAGCDWLEGRLGLVMQDVDSTGSASWVVPRTRCADCGAAGETTGHQECQYPQER